MNIVKYTRKILVALLHEVNFIMDKLEGSLRTQTDIDNAYEDLCKIIKAEMQKKLSCKRINIDSSNISNKCRRVGKPWWSETLREME